MGKLKAYFSILLVQKGTPNPTPNVHKSVLCHHSLTKSSTFPLEMALLYCIILSQLYTSAWYGTIHIICTSVPHSSHHHHHRMEDQVPARHEHSGQQRQVKGSGLAAELWDGMKSFLDLCWNYAGEVYHHCCCSLRVWGVFEYDIVTVSSLFHQRKPQQYQIGNNP